MISILRTKLFFAVVILSQFTVANQTSIFAQDNSNSDDGVEISKNPRQLTYQFNFRKTQDSWTYGFADYPVENNDFYELVGERRKLPDYLEANTSAMFISGNNHSDDLFMYVKTRLNKLKPSTVYKVYFTLEIATNAASGCLGVGGPPGEGVAVKAGASAREPISIIESSGKDYRLNVDKGNQSREGKNALNLGDVANSSTNCDGPGRYELKQLDSYRPLEARTDSKGRLWLLLGTDSGFEATTAIYYTSLRVDLLKVRKMARAKARRQRK